LKKTPVRFHKFEIEKTEPEQKTRKNRAKQEKTEPNRVKPKKPSENRAKLKKLSQTGLNRFFSKNQTETS